MTQTIWIKHRYIKIMLQLTCQWIKFYHDHFPYYPNLFNQPFNQQFLEYFIKIEGEKFSWASFNLMHWCIIY